MVLKAYCTLLPWYQEQEQDAVEGSSKLEDLDGKGRTRAEVLDE